MVYDKGIKFLFFLLISFSFSIPYLGADVIRIQYATANPEGSSHVVYIKNFKSLLEVYSKGKMTVDLHINGVKGSEHDNLMDVSTGELHMSTLAVNNITPFAPIVGFMTLPYMFPTQKQARQLFLTDNEILEELNRKMVNTANVRALSWLNSGYRVLTNSKKVIRKPSDLQGLNIRVPDNAIMVATYRAWGVEPIPLAWTKTYDAMVKGHIDGHDNAYIAHSNIPLAKKPFYELQKYITDIHYVLLILGHIVNEDFFQSLSPDLQKAMQRAAREATLEEWNWVDAENKRFLQYYLKNGMILTQPADQEREWIEKGRTVWKQFYSRIGGREFVDKVNLFFKNQ